jgi:non-ribosomal peptide synthetase component E (peptide arylation enzyme)
MTALAPPIWELAGASPQAIALEDHRRRLSFGEIEERTNAFGHGLEALGVTPGDQAVALPVRSPISCGRARGRAGVRSHVPGTAR